MKRFLLILAVFALVVPACGGTEAVSDPAPVDPIESDQSETTAAPTSTGPDEAPGDTSTSASTSTSGADDPVTTTAAPPKAVDGPAAPDFTLALADGRGEFVLSAEQKPVFMVFWAEW